MIKPLNGNILVEPIKNQTEKIYKEDDSRKDLQYAKVIAVPPEEIRLEEDTVLEIGNTVVYNPRSLTNIVVDGKLHGMLNKSNLFAVV